MCPVIFITSKCGEPEAIIRVVAVWRQSYIRKFWTQARLDSIKNLIEVTYQIQEFSSALLLGPDGKVVVLDRHKLQGEELLKTLNQLLPR